MEYLPFLLILITFLIDGPIVRSAGLIIGNRKAAVIRHDSPSDLETKIRSMLSVYDKNKWQSGQHLYPHVCNFNYALKIDSSDIGNQCTVISMTRGKIKFPLLHNVGHKSVMVLECSCNGETLYVLEIASQIVPLDQDYPMYIHLNLESKTSYTIITGWMLVPRLPELTLPSSSSSKRPPKTSSSRLPSRNETDTRKSHNVDVDTIFSGDPSGLEYFVHQSNLNDDWLQELEDSDKSTLCANIYNWRMYFRDTSNSLNSKCTFQGKKGQIVYKYLDNVPPDNVKFIYCDCKDPTKNGGTQSDKFYMMEIGSYVNDEDSIFHYIYLETEQTSQESHEPVSCVIQFGWQISILNNN